MVFIRVSKNHFLVHPIKYIPFNSVRGITFWLKIHKSSISKNFKRDQHFIIFEFFTHHSSLCIREPPCKKILERQQHNNNSFPLRAYMITPSVNTKLLASKRRPSGALRLAASLTNLSSLYVFINMAPPISLSLCLRHLRYPHDTKLLIIPHSPFTPYHLIAMSLSTSTDPSIRWAPLSFPFPCSTAQLPHHFLNISGHRVPVASPGQQRFVPPSL